MTELLTREAPDQVTGVGFAIVGVILAVWGVALMAAAYRVPSGRRWYDPRCWLRGTFQYWLGLFILVDAGLWLFLAWSILSTPDRGVPAWAAGYFTLAAIIAVVAFWQWARERLS